MSDWNKIKAGVVGSTFAMMGMPEVGYAYYQGEVNKSEQRKAEQRQFDYQVRLNDMMNEYNTPANQMARYIEAGMNPYMASVSSGTQGSAGSVSTSAPNLNYGEFANKYQATMNADMDLELKKTKLLSDQIGLKMLPQTLQSEIDLKQAQAKNLNALSELNSNKSPKSIHSDPIGYIEDLAYGDNFLANTGRWLGDKFADSYIWLKNKYR